jgi:hypothetical protein
MSKTRIVLFITILSTGALLGAFAGHHYLTHDADPSAEVIDRLEAENLRLAEENARLEFVQDLASEFSMNPTVVDLVHRYSRQYVNSSETEWRLIQTPEFMTHIMLSVIHAESKGKPDAVGDSGRARGLTQIWVSTARQYGDVTAEELLEPETNIKYSFQHFHYLLRRYKGNLALALYAWNRGAGKVDKLISYGLPPSNGYGVKVYRASLAGGSGVAAAGD